MKYELQITYDDYRAAQRLHLTSKMVVRVVLWVFLPTVVLFALGAFLAKGCQDFVIPAAVLVLILYLYAVFGLYLPYRWMKSYKRHKLLQKSFQYEFTADNYSMFHEYGSATVPWTEFHKWREGKTLFLVYQTDRLFHLIPKRIFESPEAQEQFRGYLMDNIGKPVT